MATAPPTDLDSLFHFADRGVRKLLERPKLLAAFLELIAPDLAPKLELGSLEYVERKTYDDLLHEREADLVVKVRWRDHPDAPPVIVWILLENQSRPVPHMPLRVLIYVARLLDRQLSLGVKPGELSPVLPMLLYTGEDPWPNPLDWNRVFPDAARALAPWFPQQRAWVFDLRHGDERVLLGAPHALGRVLAVMAKDHAPRADVEAGLVAAFESLAAVAAVDPSEWRSLAWFLVCLVHHARMIDEARSITEGLVPRINDTLLRQELASMSETSAQTLMRQGREIGRQEGRQEALQEALLTVLAARFAPIPEPIAHRVRATRDPAVLEHWIAATSKAESLDAIPFGPAGA